MAKKDTEHKFPWINMIGLSILVFCYAGALYNVIKMKKAEMDNDVIRIVHWQLELGIRDAISEIAGNFEELKAKEGRKVKIVQIPVTERAYGQYVTTQLIGGDPPDLIELGFFPEEFLGRYFIPLSKTIRDTNPFIAEGYKKLKVKSNKTKEDKHYEELYAEMKDASWMDTFKDGLRGQYKDSFFEYFGVGFSQFTVRMFYNKDMFREILGHDRPPASYRELMNFCEEIKSYGITHNRLIDPIASSQYQVKMLRNRYLVSYDTDSYIKFDQNSDGDCDVAEKLAAMIAGEWHPDVPGYKAGVNIFNDMAQYYPKGFMSLGRMDVGFSFVQNKAAMICSGSWDARSFLKKIQDQPPDKRFEVGIFDIPVGDKNDPIYGDEFDGLTSEASTGTGFAFGITRTSKHQDLCLEFLQFCTTPENNSKLNNKAAWIPAIRGSLTIDLLKKFEPNYVGYWGALNFSIKANGISEMIENQLYWKLISREIDYSAYADELMAKLPAAAATDYKRVYESSAEFLPSHLAMRSTFLASSVFGENEQIQENKLKLLRSWEKLLDTELSPKNYDIIIKNAKSEYRKSGRESKFADEFLKRLKTEMGE